MGKHRLLIGAEIHYEDAKAGIGLLYGMKMYIE